VSIGRIIAYNLAAINNNRICFNWLLFYN